MPRYKIVIEYEGTSFVGWQRQETGLSVQASIEDAIKKFSGENAVVFGAGRTDAGVHALGQVAHFDLLKVFPEQTVMNAVNHFLKPNLISIISCNTVSEDFHARFSATGRSYIYKIITRKAPLCLLKNKAWLIPKRLDHERMHEAAQIFIGQHDFTSFRAASCQAKSPIRTINRIGVISNTDEILIYVEAKSFLHHQVRVMVGCIKKIGDMSWDKEDLKNVLDQRDRSFAAPTAPACGLYFNKVQYSI